MAMNQPIRPIGEILVERRLISREQLERALAQQRLTKEFLGALLIRLKLIRPDVLLTALSEQFQIPHEPLSPQRVDWSVARQFPSSVLAEGRCFPIRADAESVTVAVANPLDAWALSAMERVAGFRQIKPVLVLEQELQAVLQAYRQCLLRSIESQLGADHERRQTQ